MKAALSLCASMGAVLLLWLLLPLLVLPPVAAYLGWLHYKDERAAGKHRNRTRRLISMVPMAVAAASLTLGFYILNTQYRA